MTKIIVSVLLIASCIALPISVVYGIVRELKMKKEGKDPSAANASKTNS